jgi:hypothetical protein
MEQDFIKKIAEIMKDLECPKGFECTKSGFKNIYKTKRVANEYFTCIGTNSRICPHILPFGYSNFCTCPLFMCIANESYKGIVTVTVSYPLKVKPGVLFE